MLTISLLDVLRNPTVALIYTMVQHTLIYVMMLSILFIWMDIKVPRRKTFLCGLCGMVLGILPLIIANLVWPDPLVARVWVYRLFIYPNPISGVLYYLIIKRVLKFSATRTSILMHHQLLINYIITTFFLFLNDLFCRVMEIDPSPEHFYPPDYLSYLIVVGIWVAVWFGVRAGLQKNRRYLIISPNYADKNISANLRKKFLRICIIYGIAIFFRHFWISHVSNPITATTAFIYFLLMLGMIFYMTSTTLHLRIRLMEWEMQATGTYISSLLHVNQEFRAVKHDFYNVLHGYGGYIAIENYEGLKAYHNKLFDTTKQAGDFLSLIEVLRSRIPVYSLLEAKAQKAKKNDVIFSINLVCDVADIILSDMDLCRILGIVMDNGIEEAALSKQKQMNLSFQRKDENTVVFVISNTTQGDVDTERIFEQGYTTKDDHSGIGLPQVMHILNSYEHCSARASYHDNQFTVFLILNASK